MHVVLEISSSAPGRARQRLHRQWRQAIDVKLGHRRQACRNSCTAVGGPWRVMILAGGPFALGHQCRTLLDLAPPPLHLLAARQAPVRAHRLRPAPGVTVPTRVEQVERPILPLFSLVDIRHGLLIHRNGRLTLVYRVTAFHEPALDDPDFEHLALQLTHTWSALPEGVSYQFLTVVDAGAAANLLPHLFRPVPPLSDRHRLYEAIREEKPGTLPEPGPRRHRGPRAAPGAAALPLRLVRAGGPAEAPAQSRPVRPPVPAGASAHGLRGGAVRGRRAGPRDDARADGPRRRLRPVRRRRARTPHAPAPQPRHIAAPAARGARREPARRPARPARVPSCRSTPSSPTRRRCGS